VRNALVCVLGLVTATLAGCRGTNSKSGVEKAIQAHLERRNSNLALNAFTTKVSSVRFDGDNAEAVVRFQSKQAQDMSVEVRYTLHKEGGHWVVQSFSGTGHNPHGGEMPQSPGQSANPRVEPGLPTASPPSSEPQPTPSH
jgi:hypothetical protein